MNINKAKETRLSKLENAYNQLMKVLDKELNTNEVDAEKMKAALSAYKQAAEDSDYILKQIIDLTDELKIASEPERKRKAGGLSPETRR